MIITGKPMTHQKKTFNLMQTAENGSIFDMSDCGTGKTFSQIYEITKRREAGDGPALIFAPKSILSAAWQEDFRKFSPEMRVSVAYAENRKEAFKPGYDVYITNLDAVKWVSEQDRKFFKQFAYGTMVVDESDAYKNPDSIRSKRANIVAQRFDIVRCLSATPMTRSVLDVWHQQFLIDRGKRLGSKFTAFRQSVCHLEAREDDGRIMEWVDNEGADIAVSALLKDCSIRHVLEECVDMPPNYQYITPYELPPALRQAYDTMYDQMLIETDGKAITAVNAAARATKLLQIASGAVYAEDGSYIVLDRARYELTCDLALSAEHSIIAFQWEHQKKEIVAELIKRNVTFAIIDGTVSDTKRRDIVASYQNGAYRTILIQPQSGAHGLTLTLATHTVWASPLFRAELFKQLNHRAYRKGQTQKTTTTVICANDTRDRVALMVCTNRLKSMANFLTVQEEEFDLNKKAR